MSFPDLFQNTRKEPDSLPAKPPLIWPEARFHAGLAHYADAQPARNLFTDADLISGVIVGAADGAIGWINEVWLMEGKRRICLDLHNYII